ncbi:MAG: metallophosphoesterase [Desulfobacterales bacterium]|nr:metallophosphoesterase [Desulfobacterales bacterium]
MMTFIHKRSWIYFLLFMQLLFFSADISLAAIKSVFRVEPYILQATSYSATVSFHLKEPLRATVKVFFPSGTQDFSSSSKLSHFIQITGLSPNMTYTYEVRIGENYEFLKDPSYQIKTSSLPGKSFIFTVYGDSRPGDNGTDRYHKNIIDQMVYHDPAFALVLGDMVDNGADKKLWEDFFKIESKLLRRTSIYPVFGDNDYVQGKGVFADFFPMFKKGFYRFEWGGVQFLALNTWDTRGGQNSSDFDAQSEQVKWLKAELQKDEVQKAPFRIVFMHDPVYISRGKSSEVLKRILSPIFQKYKVDVVFASWHLYERSHYQGVTYIISGGAGAELIWAALDSNYSAQAEANAYHFCRVDVQSDAMKIRSIGIDGTVLDEIILTPKTSSDDTSTKSLNISKRIQKEIFINKSENYPIIPLHLFSYDCSYCRRLLNIELPQLAKKYKVTLRVLYFDLSLKESYNLFLNAGEEFGRQGSDLPAVFIGNSVYGGQIEIEKGLAGEIESYLKNPQVYQDKMIIPFQQSFDTKTISENTFNSLTFGIVTSAGLLDGLNPCAFATLIFLISYLNLFGIGSKQMIYIGCLFILGVFLTYLGIGLLFYHYLKYLFRHQFIITAIYTALLALVALLSAISFIDFIRCLQGKTAEVTLQLPNVLKLKIQDKIRQFANKKAAMTIAPFLLGVFISGLELTCTGQVYIPIVAMVAEPRHRLTAFYYLIIYNLAFIIPLILVFILAFFGVTFSKMVKSSYYMAGVKALHVIFYLTMTFVMLFNLGWI